MASRFTDRLNAEMKRLLAKRFGAAYASTMTADVELNTDWTAEGQDPSDA